MAKLNKQDRKELRMVLVDMERTQGFIGHPSVQALKDMADNAFVKSEVIAPADLDALKLAIDRLEHFLVTH